MRTPDVDQDTLKKLSGPSVWPVLTAEKTVDRIIFRRPELCYLRILQESRKRDLPTKHINVKMYRLIYEGKRMKFVQGISASIWHAVLEDPAEDVRTFLKELRRTMSSIMPEDPDPTLAIRLTFFMEGEWKNTVTFTERWM